jgi:hypothetical protein
MRLGQHARTATVALAVCLSGTALVGCSEGQPIAATTTTTLVTVSPAGPFSPEVIDFCDALRGAEATDLTFETDPRGYLAVLRGLRSAAPTMLAADMATLVTAFEDVSTGARPDALEDPATVAALTRIDEFVTRAC